MAGTTIPAARRKQVETRDAYHCVRCGMPTMLGQWHHRRSRSVRGDHRHCSCNGIWLCAACHSWVHAHPFEARAKGWIVTRTVDVPGVEPVFNQRFGWLMLGCTGLKVQRDPPERG